MPRESFTDCSQGPIQHVDAFINENDAVTELLDLVHLMGGHQDRRPFITQFSNYILDQPCVNRVQSSEGLVNDHQLGLVQDGKDDLCLLLHAFAELAYLLLRVVSQIEAFQVGVQPLTCFGR